MGNIKEYLYYVDRSRKVDKNLDDSIYQNTLEYIEYSYRIGVYQSLQCDNDYYK